MMTREEMLAEIDALRSQGHTIGITGQAGEWQCDFDGVLHKGGTPIEAFIVARDANNA